MSLINDALKQARESQQQAVPPPSSHLQLRPVEPGQETRSSRGLLISVALALTALAVLFVAWQLTRQQHVGAALPVRGKTYAAAQPTPVPQTAVVSVPPATAPPAPAAEPQLAPGPTPDPALMPAVALAPTPTAIEPATNTPVAVAAGGGVPSEAAPVEAAAPKLGPTKLQAIVFNPTRPSVMINSKTLFVGDKLNGFAVIAIDRESVTLVAGGQTNILTLPQ
jgi:hypothetical protein